MLEADFDIDELLARASGNKPPFYCPVEGCGNKLKAFSLFRRHMETHRPKAPEVIEITASPPQSPQRITRSNQSTPSSGKRSAPSTYSSARKRKKSSENDPRFCRDNDLPTRSSMSLLPSNSQILPSGTYTQGHASLSYAESRASVYFTLSEIQLNPINETSSKLPSNTNELSLNIPEPSKGTNSSRQKSKVSRSTSQQGHSSRHIPLHSSRISQPRTCRCSIHVPIRLSILPENNTSTQQNPVDFSTTPIGSAGQPDDSSSQSSHDPSSCKDEDSSKSKPLTIQSMESSPPPNPQDDSQSKVTSPNSSKHKGINSLSSLNKQKRNRRIFGSRINRNSTLSNRRLGRLNDGNGESSEKFGPCPISNNVESKSLDVPVPKFHVDESYVLHKRPSILKENHYYRYQEKSLEELYETLEYQLEEEDLAWLQHVNEQRIKQGLPEVTERTMEYIVDRFEKDCILISLTQNDKTLPQNSRRPSISSPVNGANVTIHSLGSPTADEDAICEVCLDGTCENTNVILFCDVCNLAVHQECYGVPYIPEGPWLCRKCIHSPSQPVQCALCPNQGGAFKRTSDDKWAHVVCALWIPEVIFANLTFLEPIEHLDKVDPKRIRLQCYICKQRKVGACIQCHKSSCYKSFHVTCAQQAGLYMRIENNGSSRGDGIKKRVFCDTHSPPGYTNKGMKHSMFAYSDDEEAPVTHQQHLKRTRRILEARRQSKPAIAVPIIHLDKFKSIASHVKIEGKKDFLHAVFSFWQLKREARRGVPLLKRLQASGQRQHTFTTNEEEARRMRDQLKFWQRLRQDLEKARLLCELVRKRERMKREYVKLKMKTADVLMQPLMYLMRSMLDELQKTDSDRIFAEPVSTRIAPDYHRIIHHPMDLSTMRQKVTNHEYSSLAKLKEDFDIMVRNCHTYNSPSSTYYHSATRLADFGNPLFRDAEKILREYHYDEETGILLKPPKEVFTEFFSFSTDNGHTLSNDSFFSPKEKSVKSSVDGSKPDSTSASSSPCPLLLNKEEMRRLSAAERRQSLKSPGFITPQRQLEILTDRVNELTRMAEEAAREQQSNNNSLERISNKDKGEKRDSRNRRSSSLTRPSSKRRRLDEVPPSPEEMEVVTPSGFSIKALNEDVQDTLKRIQTLRKYCIDEDKRNQASRKSQKSRASLTPTNNSSKKSTSSDMHPPECHPPKVVKNTPRHANRRHSVSISIDSGGDHVRQLNLSSSAQNNSMGSSDADMSRLDALSPAKEDKTCVSQSTETAELQQGRRYRTRSEHSDESPLRSNKKISSITSNQQNPRRRMKLTSPPSHNAKNSSSNDSNQYVTSPSNNISDENPPMVHAQITSTGSPNMQTNSYTNRSDGSILEMSSPENSRKDESPTGDSAIQRYTRRTRHHPNVETSDDPQTGTSTEFTLPALNSNEKVEPTRAAAAATVGTTSAISSAQNGVAKSGPASVISGSSFAGAPTWNAPSYGLKPMPQLSTFDEDSDEDVENIRLEPLDVVWAKCRGYPWYPGLIIDPFMPREGYSHNGVPIPSPPDSVMQRAPEGVLQSRRDSSMPSLTCHLPSSHWPDTSAVASSSSSIPHMSLPHNSTSGDVPTSSNHTDSITNKSLQLPERSENNNSSNCIGMEKETSSSIGNGNGHENPTSASTEWYLVLFFDTKRTWQWLTRDKLEPLGVDKSIDDDKWLEAKRSRFKGIDVRQAYARAVEHMCKVNGESYPYTDMDPQEETYPFPNSATH